MGLSHTSLTNYYTISFALAFHHKYSMTDIDNMIPFERDLYVDMIADFIEKQQEEMKR